MSTELAEVSKAVAEFDRVAAGIGELQKTYGGVVYEVATPKGMEEAKGARQAIRAPRYGIETIRKEAKAPILALGKKLDAEAARITAELLKIEEPIDTQIKTEEARKERERQAKIDAEVKRVADIRERIEELRGNQMLAIKHGSELIQQHINDLSALPVDESFEEFVQAATDAKAAGLFRLTQLLNAAIEHEAEQVRIKAEREELARLKAEQQRRESEDRARIAEEDRVAREAREAEIARLAEENRKQAEAHQAERDRIAAEDRRQKEQRDQLAREQAALDAAKAAPVPTAPPKKALTRDVCNGLSVQRADDGHWITFRHKTQRASFNVEHTFGAKGIGCETVIAWIDEQLHQAADAA